MSFRYPDGAFISASYDPLQVPDAPTIGTATAGAAQATVAFTAPTNVGGSAITNYYAVSSPGGIVASGASSPITVTGLTNGVAYTFKVWAENSYGPSAYSAESNSVTPAENYIEDVFSTYLYTGTSAVRSINNGIDLSGKGGLVWVRRRDPGENHIFTDTARGGGKQLFSNLTAAEASTANQVTGFTSTGFNLGADSAVGYTNLSPYNYVAWTFREQPKFFDIVTWTGDGTGDRTISHNLGSTPGCIITKAVNVGTTNWHVFHRGVDTRYGVGYLNVPNEWVTGTSYDWNPTSTTFVADAGLSNNDSGTTYVAYLFAHNAGGFGATGNDNVITCGSFDIDGSGNATVNLGYEPQFVIIKPYEASSNWAMFDNMRGMPVSGDVARLFPNSSAAEGQATDYIVRPNATGFTATATGFTASGANGFIYIAIRRGPMKTPTVGTSVFSPIATSAAPDTVLTTGFPVDAAMYALRNTAWTYNSTISNRLTGLPSPGATSTDVPRLQTSSTAAELVAVSAPYKVDNTGFTINPGFGGSIPVIYWNFGRAPGFFDVVCYTGTGANRTVSHNLGVAPELMIVKRRNNATEHWNVYNSASGATKYMRLNQTLAASTASVYWNDTAPTSSVFTVGTDGGVNASGGTYVAYLFASLAGVSKVGSYTGTGTTLQVNCGFTGGARFVLIKRTDSTGDWYVWDSARGIVAGNDPYLLLNSTAAEVTNTDYVDTHSAGFEISSTAPAAINANGGTFIYLAIA